MDFIPYPYQNRVFAALQAGKNVILQAPTGAGKTRAALRPILQRFDRYDEREEDGSHALPLLCRYAVPMRVLATQFHAESQSVLAQLQQRGTAFAEIYRPLKLALATIQTGETPADPLFESPLTFCTIDQLLASFIGTPYSLSHRLANANVGAVVGSYLILDEFHLYPVETSGNGARLTTVAMLKLLSKVSRFCLMTATFSTKLLDQLATLLDAVVIRVDSDEELATIMQGRARTIQVAASPLDAAAVVNEQQAAMAEGIGASLAVCNTVARAQDLYRAVKAQLAATGLAEAVDLHLLHSRFTPEDRAEKSAQLQETLGETQWIDGHFTGKPTIVIATQVVEVGLNISAGVLHSEIAPANSIIQRSGRCARFRLQQGRVIVYPLAPNESGEPSYRPYNKEICAATLTELRQEIAAHGNTPLPFSFPDEQRLIDQVHTTEDERMLKIFRQNQTNLENAIFTSLQKHESGTTSVLIRDVSQVQIVIHDTPKETITTQPFSWQSFGLHPGTLKGAWDSLQSRASALALDWAMLRAIAVEPSDPKDQQGTDDDVTRVTTYTWDTVTTPAHIDGALRIVLPTALARYDTEIGFQLLLDSTTSPNGWQSAQLPSKQRGHNEDENGKIGSYRDHIQGLMRAYDASGVRVNGIWLALRLEEELRLPPSSIDYAIRLAIGCHDIGKLSQQWQAWAQLWQQTLAREYGAGYVTNLGQPNYQWLAKTDRRDWKEERDLYQRYPQTRKRPHHACEGAIASSQAVGRIILDHWGAEPDRVSLGYLMRSVNNAVARHHTPLANTYQAVAWDEAARSAITTAFAVCRLTEDATMIDLRAKPEGAIEAERLLFVPDIDDSVHATWLAFTIVRALRLCDQRAERMF